MGGKEFNFGEHLVPSYKLITYPERKVFSSPLDKSVQITQMVTHISM
jgi:hypothetical protein